MISGNSSEKLQFGNVVNMPYCCRFDGKNFMVNRAFFIFFRTELKAIRSIISSRISFYKCGAVSDVYMIRRLS